MNINTCSLKPDKMINDMNRNIFQLLKYWYFLLVSYSPKKVLNTSKNTVWRYEEPGRVPENLGAPGRTRPKNNIKQKIDYLFVLVLSVSAVILAICCIKLHLQCNKHRSDARESDRCSEVLSLSLTDTVPSGLVVPGGMGSRKLFMAQGQSETPLSM